MVDEVEHFSAIVNMIVRQCDCPANRQGDAIGFGLYHCFALKQGTEIGKLRDKTNFPRMGVHPMSVRLMDVRLMGVHLVGVCLMGVRLMGVRLMACVMGVLITA